MTTRIHDREQDTSEPVVRALLTEQVPRLAERPLSSLDTSGTTNALWRVHTAQIEPDVVVRLPRIRSGIPSIETELGLLPALTRTTLIDDVDVPRVVHHGEPSEVFEYPWAVFEWIEGTDLWSGRDSSEGTGQQLALDLAHAVGVMASLEGLPAPARTAGQRGGPLDALLDGLDRWLDHPRWSASDLVDVDAIRRSAAESAEVADAAGIGSCFLHGDLIPGNLLTKDGRLSALIDWGGAGYGDPAQDLGLAWAVLDGKDRAAFREAVDADEATWLRARAFELEQAVSGVLYYCPRGHALGDVMARTLERVLAD